MVVPSEKMSNHGDRKRSGKKARKDYTQYGRGSLGNYQNRKIKQCKECALAISMNIQIKRIVDFLKMHDNELLCLVIEVLRTKR